MGRARFLLLAGLAAAAALLGGLAYRRLGRRSLEPYARYLLEGEPAGSVPRGVSVMFLGVSTLLVTDGETALMTDGFFTRPGPALPLFLGRKVSPDRDAVARALRRAGVERLAAVVCVHSHYDHAMDAPLVAELTGAVLVGSESTANVGRGWGLPEERIVVAASGRPLRFGAFTLTLAESRHFPLPVGKWMLGRDITRPLVPPASIFDYVEGKTYSLLVGHPSGTLLVQGSAGWIPGALDGYTADVALLGLGGLGRADQRYRDEYFAETAGAVGARHVIPIHWDDFTISLDEPLRANTNLFDDVRVSLDDLIARAEADPRITFHMLPAWERVVLLPAPHGAGAP